MRNTTFRKSISLLFILLIFISSVFASFASTTKTISLYFERQKYPNWCWAATSQSIIDKIAGRRPTQAQIVTNIFGSAVNNTVNIDQDTQSLSAWGVGSYRTAAYEPFGFAVVRYDIDASKPIKATLFFNNGSGHDLVVYGYYENDTDQQIYYLDPWPTNPQYNAIKYSTFLSNSSYKVWYEHYHCYKTY